MAKSLGSKRNHLVAALVPLIAPVPAHADDGLLFALSADHGTTAERAGGAKEPIVARGARVVADGAAGPALALDDDLTLAWPAAGNIHAQRGTIAFFLRPRAALDRAPFPVFRVGYADHSSWDMAFLRIDWNGHGFDAFVTDTNLARTRLSVRLAEVPAADRWLHIAFAWDETGGATLWIDGRRVGHLDRRALYDAGLFGFGPFQRIVAPYQIQSAYNFRRSGDLDELRIYDHAIGDGEVAALARREAPAVAAARPRDMADPATRERWWQRNGWTGAPPPALDAPVTGIRKVAFTDTRDLKERMFKGADGIRETTWPGVYNRSRLPGRDDYFELPDWNVYAAGGRSYALTLSDEPWNRIEIVGAAYGTLRRTTGDGTGELLHRPRGVERTTSQFAQERRGGTIRFDDAVPETPIQEIAAYHVAPGTVPDGVATLRYTVDPDADPAAYPSLGPLRSHIAGRFVADERAVAVALPAGAPRTRAPAAAARAMPVVHLLLPADFRDAGVGRFSHGWRNMDAGLDGIAIDLPAMAVGATHDGLLPINIRVHDPLWPDRDLIDVNVSVRPNAARTLWLDTRDRILPPDASLWITIAAAGGGFDASILAGTTVRLVFKPAAAAKAEHVADRFEQARDNLSFLVEEQPNSRLYPLYDRFDRDISDVLRVDPGNAVARSYWVEKNPEQPYAPLPRVEAPAGVPEWAFRQIEDLRLYRRFVDWWIDHRQIANGEFGGGLSDDTDLVNQWVPLALMGVEPDRLAASQRRLLDATYANGMWTGGLSRIRADELHSYEEGINAVAQAMQIAWGDPTAIERGMAVAREYGRLVERNPAGHVHLVSSWFSGSDIVRDGNLGWQRPFGLLVFHPGLLLANYNGAPAVKRTLLPLLDGWLAHARDGRMPAEIAWATDATAGTGIGSAAHAFWAAAQWTGDRRYLLPILGELDRAPFATLGQLNADLLARLPEGPALAERIANGDLSTTNAAVDRNTGGVEDAAFARFVRWQRIGDDRIIADLHAAEADTARQRMHLLTEGHLWSDRVAVPSELLQRARLGGVAHRRNAYAPGNLVSWRFAAPADGGDVAILIRPGDPGHFRVTAFNLSDRPVVATMTGAELAPGRWRVSGEGIERSAVLERGRGTELVFAPGVTSAYAFTLTEPGDDPATRPDIGLSADDLAVAGGRLRIRVHGLGAKATPAGSAIVVDGAGREVAHGRFPALAAPDDLRPKTADLSLRLPPAARGLTVRLSLDGDPAEVTSANNAARPGDTIASRLEDRP